MRTRNDITRNRLKKLLSYHPETGHFKWKAPAGRYGRIPAGAVAGGINKEGYHQIMVDGVFYRSCRLAFLYMTGKWPKHQVDHINRDVGDDRWVNLREATPSQNKQNNGVRSDNKYGMKCVTFDKDRNKYTVRVTANGKRLRLGRFDTAEAAYEAYKASVRGLHGEYANEGMN